MSYHQKMNSDSHSNIHPCHQKQHQLAHVLLCRKAASTLCLHGWSGALIWSTCWFGQLDLAPVTAPKHKFSSLVSSPCFCRQHQLACLLVWHLKQGSASPFQPWLAALPRSFNNLVGWSLAELDELQLSNTGAEAEFRAQVSPTCTMLHCKQTFHRCNAF